MRPIGGSKAASGFTFVELAVVLAVMGLLMWTVSGHFLNVGGVQQRQAAERHGEEVKSAVRAFALANARLPCPDTNHDGRANDCITTSTHTGWVPYETLGMAIPDASKQAFYGVYRHPDNADAAADADLAVTLDRSGDGRTNTFDLIRGLNNAVGQSLNTDHIYVTGDEGREGAIDCVANPVRHVAFFVVVPLDDRDGDGDRFDSVHTGSCAYAPSTAVAHDRDDVVIVEGFSVLAGWLTSS